MTGVDTLPYKGRPPFGEAPTEDLISALLDFLDSKNGWKLVQPTSPK